MAHDIEKLVQNVEKWRGREIFAIFKLQRARGTDRERAARKELTRVLDAGAKAYKRAVHARDEEFTSHEEAE